MRDTLALPSGASFILADLHLHSPEDPAFTCPEGSDKQSAAGRKALAEAYVAAAAAKGLSVLGLTDHNGVEWIDELRAAAEVRNIAVFPGFELNTDSGSGGIHILCLFEPDKPKEDLDDLITQLGLPRGSRLHADGSSKLCNMTLAEAIEFVHEKGGLTIAAHVLRDHGILRSESMTGEVRVTAWQNEALLAAEIPSARSSYDSDASFAARTIRNERGLYERKRPIACIYSSDARKFEEIGSRPTWIKISSKSIEGLKQAFLDWDSRVRHPSELADDSFSRIVAIEWVGGFLDGLSLHLNDNLNCIIGGKGTGKSTIIETIRYALAQTPAGEDNVKQHQAILKDVFRSGSTVRMLVEHHTPRPTRYLIERAYPGDSAVFSWDESLNERGEEIVGLTPSDILPGAEIYGQKEILELSQDEGTQITLLQRFQDTAAMDELATNESAVLKKLDDNANEITQFVRSASAIEEKEQQLTALKEKLKQYEDLGFKEKLATQRQYVTEQNRLTRAQKEVDGVAAALRTFKEESLCDTSFLADEEVNELPHADALKQVRQALETLNATIQSVCETTSAGISEANGAMTTVVGAWNLDHKQQKDAYNALLREMNVGTVDPNDYIETERKIVELEPAVLQRSQLGQKMDVAKDARTRLINDLQRIRRDLFQVQQRAVQYVNDQLNGVLSVEIVFEGRKETFLSELTSLRTGARTPQLQKIVEHAEFTTSKFAQAARLGAPELQNTFGITRSAADSLVSGCAPEDLFRLETMAIPPSIRISLNIGSKESPNFRETSRLSVGQRCTAILMLILLHNPYPLIIDQPEDDLDNSFVYTDIVQRLRREKERRQFIIATHNANIPVLGDAELIQVLRAERGKLSQDECVSGSIDDHSLREPVETILEGGHEAFLLRQAKYGF